MSKALSSFGVATAKAPETENINDAVQYAAKRMIQTFKEDQANKAYNPQSIERAYIGDWVEGVPKSLKQQLTERASYMAEEFNRLTERIKELDLIEFKEGDVVTIPELGTAIIKSIDYSTPMDATRGPIADDLAGPRNRKDTPMINGFYANVVGKFGSLNVPLNRIVPYSTASKVLYDKK